MVPLQHRGNIIVHIAKESSVRLYGLPLSLTPPNLNSGAEARMEITAINSLLGCE